MGGFARDVKKDLCQLPIPSGGSLRAELSGLILPGARLIINGDHQPVELIVITETPMVAARFFKLYKALCNGRTPEIDISRNGRFQNRREYRMTVRENVRQFLKDLRLLRNNGNHQDFYSNTIPAYYQSKQKNLIAFLRGIYLACGTVNSPEKGYRIELVCHRRELLDSICEVLENYEIKATVISRKNQYVLFAREGESVSNFLGLIGAHKASLTVTDQRVMREMRGTVNRRVNCETANLGKTAEAAGRQLSAIRKIEQAGCFAELPENLQTLAKLRVAHPDRGMAELGQMMTPPLGKTAVYRRFEKIEKLAASL